MKKQQNPNWLSGAFTVVLLATAFILMSQSQGQNEVLDAENAVKQSNTRNASNPDFRLPTEEEFKNAKLKYVDSLGNRNMYSVDVKGDKLEFILMADTMPSITHRYFSTDSTKFSTSIDLNPQDEYLQDTSLIALAIQEIVQVPSPIMAEFNGDGEAITIKRNGKALEGEEFKTYQKAFNQLNQYATKRFRNDATSIENLAKLAGINFKENASNLSKLAQMARVDILEDSMSAAVYEELKNKYDVWSVQEQVRSMDAQQRMETLKKRQAGAKILIEQLSKNSSTEQAIQLSQYMNELAQMERYMLELKEEEGLISKENEAFMKELDRYRSQWQQSKELDEYITELKTLIEIKADRSPAKNGRVVELQLSELEREMIEILSSQDKVKRQALEANYVKKKLIGSLTEGRNPKDKGLYEHTRVTPDNETFTFAEQDGRTLWVQYAFDILYKKELKNTLFQVDGKTMKKWSFDDFKAMDFLKIIEIDFWANDDMKNHFKDTLSKRVLKNYDSVISIRTN